ncbi:MAG: tetratricopeptide repeat protein [Gaiellaceae bacterium]
MTKTAALTPYVPRLVIEWALEAPETRVLVREGTLAFVDISGFTAMSEALSSRGKAGAEEVTGVMNATFASLLELAYAFGGGLLKFGGDALLLFFEGQGHQTRAAAAVFGLRERLAEIGRPETSVGPVELRMHVGLHSDTFTFFLVGETHRELIVAGPAASHTVVMESESEAGDLLLSAQLAAALPPHVLGEPKGGGILLAAPPEAETRLEPLPDLEGLDLERFVPVEIRANVATPAAEAEHRAAAVAFLHVGGLDELSPEEAAEALDTVVRSVQSAAAEYGVCFLETDIDRGGTKIILTAGAPHATENDEERMLRAVRAVLESEPPLPIRAGISRGRVFAGEVGAPFRRTYTILGDTAALAARLMSRAQPGQALAAAAVVERSRTEFEVVELEPFQVKGKSEPVKAVELGPVRGTRPEERRHLPLVDRVREMAILDAALAPVRMGFGSLVELVGEPGIGKSRIVRELGERAAELRRVAAACEEYEATTAYHPFRDLLRELLGVPLDGSPEENTERLRRRLDEIDPELIPWIPLLALPLDVAVLPTAEVEELQPAFRRARLHGVVGTLVGSLLDDPSLLLFEDVHWMDEASSDLLRHLASQIATRPWFACATRRPIPGGFSAADGVPPLPALTLRLEPLPAEDARELIMSAAGIELPEEELEAITARAGGNPLFLQELAGADAEAEELPESVEAMVAAKVDRLTPADRALLRWASVLGSAFSGELISEVLRDDPEAAVDSEAWDRLGEFVERDTDVAGGFRFRHALIRDTAYEGLPFARRQELHARVAEAYEQRAGEDEAELLSLHFSLGSVHDKAWTYSRLAGERAKAKYANVDAAELYRRALQAAAELPELDPAEIGSVWEALAEVLLLAGRLAEAATALTRARRLARHVSQAPLALKEGRLREELGLYSDAIHWYGRGFRALEHIPDLDRRALWRLELKVAHTQARFRQGRYEDVLRLCKEIAATAQDLEDFRSLAHAYYLLHVVHTLLGNEERAAFRGLALPIYEEIGDLGGQASVLNNLGIEAYYEGRWEAAHDLYERSRDLRRRTGDVINVALTTNNIGEILSDQGHLDDAVAMYDEALAIAQDAGQGLIVAMVTGNLGRAAARTGRFEDAERLLHTALEALRQMKSPFAGEMLARRAELLVFQAGAPQEAIAAAEAALAEADGPAVEAMIHRVRGYALRQAGEPQRAQAAFEESLRVAQEAGAEYETALTLSALGRAYEADEILTRLGVVAVREVPDAV